MTSSVGGSQASCYISDEDLLDLAQLPLYNDIRVPEHFGVYAYGYPTTLSEKAKSLDLPPMGLVQSLPTAKRMTPGKGKRKRRRRSSPLEAGRLACGMTPILEVGE